jgi:cytosine/adenosine deaminase-related metal-dependent hydrolase
MGSLLFENGIALLRDANGKVVPAKTSILIEGSKIVKIGKTIQAGPNTEVIDCTDKVISPGFIDTHHHGWQTQLKGRHANELLLDYLVTGMCQFLSHLDSG